MAMDFPASPSTGDEYTASNGVTYEWDGVVWSVVQSDSSDAFLTNNNTVTSSYTLPSGRNAVSAGPVEIPNGVIVTVPNTQSWVVV